MNMLQATSNLWRAAVRSIKTKIVGQLLAFRLLVPSKVSQQRCCKARKLLLNRAKELIKGLRMIRDFNYIHSLGVEPCRRLAAYPGQHHKSILVQLTFKHIWLVERLVN